MTNRAVSLFSNCGAGDFGYHRAGFHFDVMAELNPRRLSVCVLNHPEAECIPDDLRQTWESVVVAYRIRARFDPPALLSACPPCQGMSTARSGLGKGDDPDAGSKDKRNLLVEVIADVARALEPRVVVIENVPAFLTRQVRRDPDTGEGISAARLLISQLRKD